MELEFSQHIFGKKLRRQVSLTSVQWVKSCSMWMDRRRPTDRQIDVTTRTVAFRYFENAPKNQLKHFRGEVSHLFSHCTPFETGNS